MNNNKCCVCGNLRSYSAKFVCSQKCFSSIQRLRNLVKSQIEIPRYRGRRRVITNWSGGQHFARYVYEKMIGLIPDDHFIHHKDGNWRNDHIENLEIEHKGEHSRKHNSGEKNYQTSLTNEKVSIIKSLCKHGYKVRLIAKLFKVPEGIISDIKNGWSWRPVPEYPYFREN